MSSIRQKADPFMLNESDPFGLNEPDPYRFYETQPPQKGPDLQPPQSLWTRTKRTQTKHTKLHGHRRPPQPTTWTITTTMILTTTHDSEIRWRRINRRWMRCHHLQSPESEHPRPSTKTKHQNKHSWAQHLKTNKTQTGKNGKRTKQNANPSLHIVAISSVFTTKSRTWWWCRREGRTYHPLR